MALYLLKRAGYDIRLFGRTLAMLQMDDLSPTTQRLFAFFEDHPSLPDREKSIDVSIEMVEKDFETRYCVENKSVGDRVSKMLSRGMDYVWAALSLFA